VFKWFLDWISRAEALSSFWSMLESLEWPPGWLAWPAALLGLAFIWWDVRRWMKRYPRASKTEAVTTVANIRVILGTGAPFDILKNRLHTRNRLIRIGVQNLSTTQRLTNCEVILNSITGRLANKCPVKVEAGFSLNPGAIRYIDFVDFDETISGPPISNPPTIRAHFPINPLSNGESYLDDQPYDLVLKATAAETPSFTERYRLWIDQVGSLRLEPSVQSLNFDTEIWKAIAHVALVLREKKNKDCLPQTRIAIRQAALDAKIRVRGRKQLNTSGPMTFSEVHSDVPASYWANSTLNALSTEEQHSDDEHTFPEASHSWGPKGINEKNRYASLLVSMQEIESLWP
jgi:hypothetical protein